MYGLIKHFSNSNVVNSGQLGHRMLTRFVYALPSRILLANGAAHCPTAAADSERMNGLSVVLLESFDDDALPLLPI